MHPSPNPPPESKASTRLPGEVTVLWVIWLTYGSFYFCRQNISAAVPGLQADGLNKTQIGAILGALKIAYAIGQLVNGQLAERFSARWLLAIGMLGSAALSVVFGLAEGFYFLLFVWACNGYCQALGWTPCIRVAANWISVTGRGRALAIIGTSYQVMAGVTYLVAGYSAQWFGWRGAMFVPAGLLVLSAIHMLLFLREKPVVQSASAHSEAVAGTTKQPSSFRDNILTTLSNPALWILAIGLALLDACRYGFQDWGLAHLKDVQKGNLGATAAKYAVLPAGGILGALFGGWATDRFFNGRRAPVICGMLVLLGALTLLYDSVSQNSSCGTVLLLFWIGFAIFGPQVLLVGTAPTDLAKRGTAAAAAGFVNFMGYLGAFAGDQVTGFLADKYNWQTAIYFWAGCAFAAACVVTLLWRVGPNQRSEIRGQRSEERQL
jgi:sugar phosphate permease